MRVIEKKEAPEGLATASLQTLLGLLSWFGLASVSDPSDKVFEIAG